MFEGCQEDACKDECVNSFDCCPGQVCSYSICVSKNNATNGSSGNIHFDAPSSNSGRDKTVEIPSDILDERPVQSGNTSKKNCEPGERQSCYPFDVSRLGTGECVEGTKECLSDGSGFSEICKGAVGPTDEVCDDLDNNCNEEVDEGISCSCQPDSSAYGLVWSEDFSNFDPNRYDLKTNKNCGMLTSEGGFRLVNHIVHCNTKLFLKQRFCIAKFEITFDYKYSHKSFGMSFAFFKEYTYPKVEGGFWGKNLAIEGDGYAFGYSIGGKLLLFESPVRLLKEKNQVEIPQNVFKKIKISFDNGHTKIWIENKLVLEYVMKDYQAFSGYFGFTGATAGHTSEQFIDNINLKLLK